MGAHKKTGLEGFQVIEFTSDQCPCPVAPLSGASCGRGLPPRLRGTLLRWPVSGSMDSRLVGCVREVGVGQDVACGSDGNLISLLDIIGFPVLGQEFIF